MGRLPLFVLRRRHKAATLPWSRAGVPPTIFRPSLVYLESRWIPDDILSTAPAPRSVGGTALLAGSHITPMRLLLGSAPPAHAGPSSQPDTSASPYRYTDAEDPLFSDSQWSDLDFVATAAEMPPDEGLDFVDNSSSGLPNTNEPAEEAAINDGDKNGFAEPLTGIARISKPLATTSLSSPPVADLPAKLGAAGDGGGGSGPSTPNADMGGGPAGGGSANLHLPGGLTSLQRLLPNDTVAAPNNIAPTPAATNPVPGASNAALPRNADPSQKECYP